MFNLFKSSASKKSRRKEIALISIHIPKTAGTSFRNILKEVYGVQAVIRLDISLKTNVLRINEQLYDQHELPSKTEVIHGHFTPALLRQRFELNAQIPMITWLRHPVDRVLSNYFYLEKRLKEELQEEAKGLDILSKMQRSLMEYASGELNQNRQSKFLTGVALEDLAFVGIQEHYSDDLQALAHQMGWSNVRELKQNITGTKYSQVSQEERDEIARLNELDMALYEKGLQLRQQRLAHP